jgi:hypothetical protein
MKNFNWTKYLITTLIVYIVFEISEFLVHSLILGGKYEALADSGLFRENMESKMWIMYVTALVFSIFFVYLYHYFANAYKTGWMSGLYFGLIVGFMMNIMGMFNQYATYPVPEDLAWNWVIFSILQVALVGVVAGLLYQPKAITE